MSDTTEHEHGVCIATLGPTGLLTELVAGGHALHADEPVDNDGTEQGPSAVRSRSAPRSRNAGPART